MTRFHAVRTLAPQPRPPGIYASNYTPELGLWICARLAAGESLRSICRDDPSMPTEKTVWNWARAHPEFAAWRIEALTTARRARRAAHAARLAARRARWTDPSSAGGKFAGGRGSGGRPAWNRGLDRYGTGIADEVLDRLREGEPLVAICRDPDMPSVGTIYNWLRAYPAFQAEYRRARETGARYILTVAAEGAPWLGAEGPSMRALKKILRAAYQRCARLAPKTYAEGVYGPQDPIDPYRPPWP